MNVLTLLLLFLSFIIYRIHYALVDVIIFDLHVPYGGVGVQGLQDVLRALLVEPVVAQV